MKSLNVHNSSIDKLYYFIVQYRQGEWMNYCLIQQGGWNLQTSHWGENIRPRRIHTVQLHIHIYEFELLKLRQNSFVTLEVRIAVVTLKKAVCVMNGQGHQNTIPQCVECSISWWGVEIIGMSPLWKFIESYTFDLWSFCMYVILQ